MANMLKIAHQGKNSIISMSFRSQTNFQTILKRAKKGKLNAFRRGGAYVRGIMRRLIKHRKNPNLASPVGTPPYAHFLPGIKNTIQFVASSEKVIIGPQLDRSKPNISPVPGALEYGGYTMVKTFRKRKKMPKRRKAKKGGVWVGNQFYRGGTMLPRTWAKGSQPPSWYRRKNPLQAQSKVRRKIRPRPYANPALKIFTTSPLYKEIWKDCIK
ncbi:MAG: hypothetical protein ACK528_14000 [Alphaproteobacteria bacterium]|jgi:hypothetical protein